MGFQGGLRGQPEKTTTHGPAIKESASTGRPGRGQVRALAVQQSECQKTVVTGSGVSDPRWNLRRTGAVMGNHYEIIKPAEALARLPVQLPLNAADKSASLREGRAQTVAPSQRPRRKPLNGVEPAATVV